MRSAPPRLLRVGLAVVALSLAAGDAKAEDDRVIDLGGATLATRHVTHGSFTQGSLATEVGHEKDEEPAHQVTLTKDFWMGKFPVTRGQFAKFVADTRYVTEAEKGQGGSGWDGRALTQKKEFFWRSPGFTQTDEHPVVLVTYADATAFVGWASRKSGQHVRLPTEAEWEYAARAGTTTPWYAAAEGDATAIGWFKPNAGNGTRPVGQKRANALGLFDMSGNVFEWCRDVYAPYREGAAVDPESTSGAGTDPERRVLRGGSWLRDPKRGRSADRHRNLPGGRNADNGFRVVVTIEEEVGPSVTGSTADFAPASPLGAAPAAGTASAGEGSRPATGAPAASDAARLEPLGPPAEPISWGLLLASPLAAASATVAWMLLRRKRPARVRVAATSTALSTAVSTRAVPQPPVQAASYASGSPSGRQPASPGLAGVGAGGASVSGARPPVPQRPPPPLPTRKTTTDVPLDIPLSLPSAFTPPTPLMPAAPPLVASPPSSRSGTAPTPPRQDSPLPLTSALVPPPPSSDSLGESFADRISNISKSPATERLPGEVPPPPTAEASTSDAPEEIEPLESEPPPSASSAGEWPAIVASIAAASQEQASKAEPPKEDASKDEASKAEPRKSEPPKSEAPKSQRRPPEAPKSVRRPEAPKSERRPEAPKSERRPEAPKSERRPEAPKSERRPEAPKSERRPPEAPKSEPRKSEPRKSEPPKAPKDEAPKDEAPKAETPKDEAPKDEAPKAETPKDEAPKDEAPKAETPKDEAPKDEAPKAETPKDEAPKDEAPKAEAPKDEAPKDEAPKAEAPKDEAPKS